MSWKDRIAQPLGALLPLVRLLVQHGTPALRNSVWNRISHTRLMGVHRCFTVDTKYGRFTGDSSDMLSQYVYYFGHWEPQVSQLIKRRLRPGQTFVDVGANTGWYTVLAGHSLAPSGGVVSIEASPKNFAWLSENVACNGLANVRLVNEAVWSSDTHLPLFQGPSTHSGVTTVVPSFAASRGCTPAGHIRARPLRDLLTAGEIATLRILKIDVEGAEREVLRGAEPMLDAAPDDMEIFLELSPSEYDVDELLRPLRKRGFRVWIVPNRYEPAYYLDLPTLPTRSDLEELVGTPTAQLDVLLSRQGPCGLPT